MAKLHSAVLATSAVVLATTAQATDQKSAGYPFEDIRFSQSLPGIHLGLENKATVKTADARKLSVTGPDPQLTVTGIAACRSGARLAGVQALAGSVVNNNGQITPMQIWGASPVLTDKAGQSAAQVSIPLSIKVTRTYQGEAVDLTFNPARAYELKLRNFVNNGGSAAQYLQTAEAFDMTVPVYLIAWCKVDAGSGALSGQTRGGYVRREVPATILFSGDPTIVDGIGVRAAGQASGGVVAAPEAGQERKRPARARQPAAD